MNALKKFGRGVRPIQILALGFFLVIIFGALLLTIPAMTVDGKGLPFLDALFTATSASCVTGLVVVDTGTFFTPLGQVVVLVLIQLGGLGFMSVATLMFMMIGKRISLRERMTIAESLGQDRLQGVVKLCINVMKITLTVETIGALLLSTRFIPIYGLGRGIWYSIFHSISAFCNAGFDLIGNYNSLVPFASDVTINFTIMGLIIAGGLGFCVILDLLQHKRQKHLKLQSKLVILGTVVLLIGGASLFLLFEHDNPSTMGNMTWAEKILASLFQSTTTRTAGFNSIDQQAMTNSSKLLSILLMYVGGGPAGTAGGIKLTTMMLIFFSSVSYLKNRQDIVAFKRRIAPGLVKRATTIALIGASVLIVASLLISYFERHLLAGQMQMIDLVFEVASAMGTVGLTAGFTELASPVTRILLIIVMYMGRVGMLTLALSLGSRTSGAQVARFPEEGLMVG